ncbi:hypothetical protein ACFRFH_11955 [Leifsonia sp. NPDC056824]|uniref:hypothetical protein n=1 Tax=Leifsonia sp. NPDC056824 TaxID=3345953 RepID=UPI003699BDD7
MPARVASERRQIEARYNLSAREWFPYLRQRLLASRPVIESFVVNDYATGTERTVFVYGKPTFRNVLQKDGSIV